jgi:hypothetical protein
MTWKYPISINIQKYPTRIHNIRISQFPGGSQNLKSSEALRLNYARAEADRSDRVDRGERGEQRDQWERNHRRPGRTGAGPDPKLARLPLR